MDLWSWTISGLGAVGENNSNLPMQNFSKGCQGLQKGTDTLWSTPHSFCQRHLWSRWPWVILLWFTSSPRNSYAARQPSKGFPTSLTRAVTATETVSHPSPASLPSPPFSSPHLFWVWPKVVARIGPSTNAPFPSGVDPVTQLTASFGRVASLWPYQPCLIPVSVPSWSVCFSCTIWGFSRIWVGSRPFWSCSATFTAPIYRPSADTLSHALLHPLALFLSSGLQLPLPLTVFSHLCAALFGSFVLFLLFPVLPSSLETIYSFFSNVPRGWAGFTSTSSAKLA